MNEHAIIQAVLENRERIEKIESQMLTRDEFYKAYDEIITILRRLDQERLSLIDWQRRQDEDITKLKLKLLPSN